jgi:hypothetical protein
MKLADPPRGAVVASRPHVEEDSSRAILSCHVEARGDEEPSSLWFEFPVEFAPSVACNGDPFLPILLLLAMRHRSRLTLEMDVSPELLSKTRRIMGIYQDWTRGSDEALEMVEIEAVPGLPRKRGAASGAFFTCGVDSFYTLLKNLARYPEGDPRLISYLLLVHGFDIPLEGEEDLFRRVRANAGLVAQTCRKTLIPVKTNARALLRSIDWGDSHGAALAGVALALEPLLHTVFIPSTASYLELAPNGSHPALDPLWSTEALECIHDGAESTRGDKIQFISSSSLALRCLRVCWENPNGAYNCGRCEKCLRTMVQLQVCGVLDRAETFPNVIDPALVEQLVVRKRYGLTWWGDLLKAINEKGSDPDLARAIERMLAGAARANSPFRRARAAIRRLFP